MPKTRTRLVNFRLTDEEFERLKTASGRHGARCLSEFARTLMLGQSNSHPFPGSCDEKLNLVDRRLTVVEQAMSRLVDALSGAIQNHGENL